MCVTWQIFIIMSIKIKSKFGSIFISWFSKFSWKKRRRRKKRSIFLLKESTLKRTKQKRGHGASKDIRDRERKGSLENRVPKSQQWKRKSPFCVLVRKTRHGRGEWVESWNYQNLTYWIKENYGENKWYTLHTSLFFTNIAFIKRCGLWGRLFCSFILLAMFDMNFFFSIYI